MNIGEAVKAFRVWFNNQPELMRKFEEISKDTNLATTGEWATRSDSISFKTAWAIGHSTYNPGGGEPAPQAAAPQPEASQGSEGSGGAGAATGHPDTRHTAISR